MDLITKEDIDFIAQQSTERINMILSGMTALMQDTDRKVEMVESQKWYQRMIKTLTGKNKITKEEIQKNHDKLSAYMSQAIAALYERGCISEKIMMNLGTQLNELYADHVQLKEMLKAFVNKLNEKIKSVDEFNMLEKEIEQGVYSLNKPIVSVCKVLSQLDMRMLEDDRKMGIIQRALSEKSIITYDEQLLTDFLKDITEIPMEDVGEIYLELETLHNSFIANIIIEMIEGYHFLPDMARKLKDKNVIVEEVIRRNGLDTSVSLSTGEIYEDFINCKIEIKNNLSSGSVVNINSGLAQAEALFLDYKLDEAFELFEALAEEGNGRAMYFLGEYYDIGYGSVKADEETARMWRMKGRDAGDVLAALNVAYSLTDDSPESERIFAEMFRPVLELAENGDIIAQNEVSELYQDGLGCEKSEEKFLSWVTRSAEAGYWNSMVDLSYYYCYVKEQFEDALKWTRKAIEIGNAEAMDDLGNMYYFGKGVEEDYCEAFKWYKKAADSGYDMAMNSLGNMYYYGEGVEEDYAEAIKWYKKAADLGNDSAMNNLGYMYYFGNGVEEDYAEAIKWYKKAADLDNDDAMNMLGNMYYRGEGVEQDYGEAFVWYKKAADCDNKWTMGKLGHMYYYGEGVEQDYGEAFDWYKKAADLGNDRAMNNLGYMYYRGEGVEQDYGKAFDWYKKAADLDNDNAMNMLGHMYYRSEGVEQDYGKAFVWYKKAADLGSAWGQANLAFCYKNGKGVNIDTQKAVEWARKAAEQGNDNAKKYLKEWRA